MGSYYNANALNFIARKDNERKIRRKERILQGRKIYGNNNTRKAFLSCNTFPHRCLFLAFSYAVMSFLAFPFFVMSFPCIVYIVLSLQCPFLAFSFPTLSFSCIILSYIFRSLHLLTCSFLPCNVFFLHCPFLALPFPCLVNHLHFRSLH